MCAMVEAQRATFLSSAASTACSQSVITWSSCLTVSFHVLASKLLKVSSLFPLNFGGSSPLNFASDSRSQNTRWFANWPTEWFPLLSVQLACSGVRPATAVFAGTNHSALLCVDRSCSSRTALSVIGFSCWAKAIVDSDSSTPKQMNLISISSPAQLEILSWPTGNPSQDKPSANCA